tara:strand:- start:1508 stop:1690 length:183 start_codon:yes stop_codon:yes gene_type:complete
LDDLKWGDRMSPGEIEDKVMEELPENHREVIKQLNPEEESVLDLQEQPLSVPEPDINEVR